MTVTSPASAAPMPSAPSQRPPYRLRDLKARERWVAGVLVLVMMAPFVLSVGRAIRADWYPLGDDALISLGFVEGSFAQADYAHRLLARDALLPVASPLHPLARAERRAPVAASSSASA